MIQGKNVIKRISAAVLSAVMFFSSLPGDVYASTNQSETVTDIISEETVEEDTYNVEISVTNVDNFTYAIVSSIDNAPEVSSFKDATILNGKCLISNIPKDNYILVRTITAASGCTEPKMKVGGTEAQKTTISIGSQAVEVWCSGKITEDITIGSDNTKKISVEAEGIKHQVNLSTENVASIEYKTYTVNDSFLVVDPSGQVDLSNPSIEVEDGKNLAITKITPVSGFDTPAVSVGGAEILSGIIGYTEDSKSLEGYNIGTIKENKKEVSIVCTPNVEYTVEMNLENATKVTCVAYTKDEGTIKVNFTKDATIVDNVATIKVPADCYLAIKDIDFSYPKKGTVEKGGTPIYSTNFNFGEAYCIGQISGNILKNDDTNKIVIKSEPPTTMHEVKVPVENIKSLQFVIYTDNNNITSDCIVDGSIVDEDSKKYAKVDVAAGSFVAIKADSIKKADGDYLAPYVVQNGITKSEEIVGKYVATTTTDLKGYVLGKVDSDAVAANINSSFKVIADHATYDVNITALCAKQIKYKIFDNSDYSVASDEEKTVNVTTIGQNKKGITIEVPTGKYLAITEIVGIDGCHGTESVTKGAEKLTKDSVGFKLGKITKDITEGITAEIIETAYDVTINIPYDRSAGTTKPRSVKYVVTSDINSVNTTTESKNVTYDNNNGKVTIKVDKSKYLVITDFVPGEDKAARTKIEFKKYAVDKNNNVSGEKETISYGKVGQYSSGTFLNGWNIGKVLNPMPLTDGQGAKTYVLDAKCFNYNMYLETKQSQNVSVTYTSGTTNEINSGKTRHYVTIKDEDTNGISADDVVLHIEEDGKPFTSNEVKAYAVNEYTNVKSLEVPLGKEGDGNYKLPADKIVEWTKAQEQFTKIVIVCEGNKNIIFPTVTESGVKIYEYVEGKKESAYGSPDNTGVLNNDDGYKKPIPYNSTFQFVAIPEDGTNFEVKSVTKEYGSAELTSEKKTLADDSTVTCYTIQKITSDVKLNTLLMTKSTADVTYSVDNQSNGEATFTSSNSSKTNDDKYKVQTGVDYVNFKVTVDKSIAPTVKCGEGEPSSYDEVEESGHSNLSTGKVEYSYKVLAKNIKDKTIQITTKQVSKDFYLQSKDNEINVIVSYNDSPIIEEDEKASDYNKGFTIHHYKVPYGKTINVQAIPLKNCKLTNAIINYGTADVHNDKPEPYGTDGVIKYTVNDSNSMLGRDFVLGSKALTTLYVSEAYKPANIDEDGVFVDNNLVPITNNEGTFEVRKNLKNFRAAILDGSEAVAMDASNIRYEAKVGNTVVTNDIIVGVEDYKELDPNDSTALKDPATKGLLKFDFEKASIAGKTVEVKIYRNNIVLGKLKFKVSPALETVSVGRNKNNSISQEYLSDKTYKLSYNSGVKAQDVAFTCEYYDIKRSKWVRFQDTKYEKVDGVWNATTSNTGDAPDGSEKLITYDQTTNSIKISANKDTLQDMAVKAGYKSASGETPGLPKIRINFYDVTDKDFVDFNTYGGCDITKEITFTMNTLRGITPTASFLSASDTYLNIGLTAPKQYAKYKDSLYYVVKAEACDRYNGKFPENVLLPEKTVIVPMTEVAAKIDLAKNGIVPGQGKAWKYNVTVTIGAYNKDLIVSNPDDNKYFEHSKNKVINKVSTKEPYYETKIKASAKTNKIYQGQKNVQVATAVFDKKTTYYDLELRMYKKGTSLAEALAEDTELVACDNSVSDSEGKVKLSQDTNNPTRIILDSTGIEPGEYVLYITPEAAGRGNYRSAYASSASVSITVYESIKGLQKGGRGAAKFDVSVPSTSLYRKDNSTASMTAKAVFGNKPKSTKVTWKIKGVEGATTDITKFVSINSSGKITVSKNFKYETELGKSKNNRFIVYAVAADYTSDSERKSTEKTVTIRPYTSQVTGLKLMNGAEKATPEADGKYVSSAIDGIYAYGVNINDCTVKTSNSKVIAVGDVKDNTCKLVVKGAGKTRITVTSNDGGKSSKYIDVTIKNKSYEQLGLKIGEVLHDGDEYNNFSNLIIKDINVVDESEDEEDGLKDITSYSLKVVSGGKLYAKDSHKYDLVPTATTTKLVLIDNTKNKKTEPSLYSQTIIINNNSINIGKLKAGLTKTSYKPSEGGGILKVSGFPKDISPENYKIALVADYADYTKNKDRYEYFLSLESNKLFNAPGDISMSSGLEYVAKYKMPVSKAEIKMPQGSAYGKAIGSYKFNAYILDEDSKIVAIVSLPKIQLKAADKPKFDLIGGYTVKKESGETAKIGLDVTKTQQSKVNAWKVVDVKDANIGGAINNKFSEYYEVNTLPGEDNGIIKAKSTVENLDFNQNIYADVTYMYEDLAGKKYYVTKRIYVKATEY